MPSNCVDTALTGYSNENICQNGAGILRLFVAEYSSVDWEASTIVNGEVTSVTMENSETFFEVNLNNKLAATFAATFTDDTQLYEVLSNFVLDGGTKAQRDFIESLFGKCLVGVLFLGNCTERWIGVDQDANGALIPPTPLQISNHLDDAGQLGSANRARNEFTLRSQQYASPLFGSIGVTNIPTP